MYLGEGGEETLGEEDLLQGEQIGTRRAKRVSW